jgi:hypothetical protein
MVSAGAMLLDRLGPPGFRFTDFRAPRYQRSNIDLGEIPGSVAPDLLHFWWERPDEDPVFRLVDDLSQPFEGGVGLYPAILISGLGVLVLQLS